MRQNLTMRTLQVLALLACTGGAGIFWWSQLEATASQTPVDAVRPVSVTAHPVQQSQGFKRAGRFTGVVRAARQSDLGFQRQGKLEEMLVDEGDVVDANTPIARLDCRRLHAQLDEAAAQLTAAKALLDELIAGPRKETIAAARAKVAQLEADQGLQSSELARLQRLKASNAVSDRELEQAQFGTASATAKWNAAQRELDELLAGTRKERIASQRAVVAQLNAAVDQLTVDIEDSELRAPYAGRVAKRMANEGETISTGAPVVRLIEASRLEAWIGVPPAIAATWDKGAQVSLRIDERDVDAVVQSFVPELDPATRTQTVIFSITGDANGRALLPDVLARVEATVAVDAWGNWVPNTALTRSGGGMWSVAVVNPLADDTSSTDPPQWEVERRDVVLLHREQNRSYIQGPIADGERIITDALHTVADGQRVVVRNSPPAQAQ